MNELFKTYPDLTLTNNPIFDAGVIETIGYFDPEKYHDVLLGRSVVYIARGLFPKDSCKKIVTSFNESKDKYIYAVTPLIESIGRPLYTAERDWRDEYFNEAHLVRDKLDKIYVNAGTENFVENVVDKIKIYFRAHQVTARSIEHNNKKGFYGIMRSWGAHGVDAFGRAAVIHEDRTQLQFHKGLETEFACQNVLASTCIYYSNGLAKGELIIYDLRPSLNDSLQQKLPSHGYGYSNDVVSNIKKIIIRPEPGDVITFFSDYMHVVNGAESGLRVNSTFFSAFNSQEQNILMMWS